jgi:putative transposase
MDFVSDQLVGGRRFRVLTLVDLYSRECLALRAGFSLKGGDVAAVLKQLKQSGRKPETITVDDGSKFTSKKLDTGSNLNDVKLDFIRPVKLFESCHIESFNGKLRDEYLNMNLFFTLAQVAQTVANWRYDYNYVRPHRSQGGVPPSYSGEHITHGVPNPDFSI